MPKRTGALFERDEVFVASAVVAAHAHAQGNGFRQRDAKFLIELFSNWVEHSLRFRSLMLQNTQVSRYLDELVAEGFARRVIKQKSPLYHLTRVGLIDLISRMVSVDYFLRPERFLFTLYFVRNYKPRIIDLMKSEGSRFPFALELEVSELLDETKLLERQIQIAENEVEKLNKRIYSALDTAKLAGEMYARGASDAETVNKIDERHPYELSSQKPLAELFENILPQLRRWELESGSLKRAEEIWIPSRDMLLNYLNLLRKFQGQYKEQPA